MPNVTLEVFVDDFIALTDELTQAHILQVYRSMLHGITAVFTPPEVTDPNEGYIISEKRLVNLGGLWDHIK